MIRGQEKQLLDYLIEISDDNEAQVSIEQLQVAMNIKEAVHISALTKKLIEKGYITKKEVFYTILKKDKSITDYKLPTNRIEAFKQLRKAGFTYEEIGKHYGLSRQRIYQIVTNT